MDFFNFFNFFFYFSYFIVPDSINNTPEMGHWLVFYIIVASLSLHYNYVVNSYQCGDTT